MLELELAYEDGRCSFESLNPPLTIGRAPDCDLKVKSWRVARQHARISDRAGTLFLEDLGSLGGTFVNGERITEYGPLSLEDEIIVGPCKLRILDIPQSHTANEGNASSAITKPEISPPFDVPPGHVGSLHESASQDLAEAPTKPPANELDNAIHKSKQAGQGSSFTANAQEDDEAAHHRRRLHKALLEALDLRRRDILSLSDVALKQQATDALTALLQADTQLPDHVDRQAILKEVVDEAVGLGPLEPLLADSSVTEIMVNSPEDIYVERNGRLERHARSFSSEQAVEAIIDRIVAPLGRRVDESSPMVDARLRDGSRVNAVIRPVALRGPCLTIRKFPERRLEMDDLIAVGSLDAYMAAFLAACVQQRKSVLVSGGTGSGKTTLLNVLSNCIPGGERVITIEDAAELRLSHAHLVSLESRPENAEGKGRVQIRDLVRNALRMRPDRIIVGECRGAEAFDMLAAMNTGHEGSLTTLHANTPRDALARLETMILMAGMDLPLAAIREHIASAVDVVVQQARLSDGHRLITAIVEVTGIEGGRIQIQELFRFTADPEPAFQGCSVQPECFERDSFTVPLEWLGQTTLLQQRSLSTWTSCSYHRERLLGGMLYMDRNPMAAAPICQLPDTVQARGGAWVGRLLSILGSRPAMGHDTDPRRCASVHCFAYGRAVSHRLCNRCRHFRASPIPPQLGSSSPM